MRKVLAAVFCVFAAGCSEQPAYLDESKDIAYYREHPEELKADRNQCGLDALGGRVPLADCERVEEIGKTLWEEGRAARAEAKAKALSEQNKRNNEAVKEALKNTEIDLKWGN